MTAKVLHIDRQAIKIAVGDSTGAKTNSTGVGKMETHQAGKTCKSSALCNAIEANRKLALIAKELQRQDPWLSFNEAFAKARAIR